VADGAVGDRQSAAGDDVGLGCVNGTKSVARSAGGKIGCGFDVRNRANGCSNCNNSSHDGTERAVSDSGWALGDCLDLSSVNCRCSEVGHGWGDFG
jgi:hypothetical protein